MEALIFKEIVIIFALSIGVLLICHRLGLPTVVGFLLTGVLCGPHSLGLVKGVEDVENLATLGVVLLLFTVGMEFSIKNIVKYKFYFFGGGVLQVFGSIAACLLISKYAMGFSWGESIFLGFLLSLSSTAIVLRALDEQGDGESPHGRLILGILIFQDVIAVPMMLLIPLLAGEGEGFDLAHMQNLLVGMIFLLIVAIAAFRGVPKLLFYVTRTRKRELFLVSVLTICFVVAWATSSVGLSLSLGAFFAGLVISESEYSSEAIGQVLPFQEIFTSFFFVSMGMLLDVSFVIQQPFLILGITGLALLVKFMVAGGSAVALGMPLRAAILAGVALSQVGEFSFVLAHSGMEYGLISDYNYQLFLAVSLLTMTFTPSLMMLSHKLAHFLGTLPLPLKLKMGYNFSEQEANHKSKRDHIIIVGFGVRGRHLARAAKEADLPYVVLEMNPETVKVERGNGEPIFFGDPSHHAVLLHAGIKNARTVAVVINDAAAAKRIVKTARELNPDVYIITRTMYFREVQPMFKIGANDVIPDEFGSSLEIFTRVLQKFEVSHSKICQCVDSVRIEGYETLRWQSLSNSNSNHLDPNEARIETVRLGESSPLVGKTILNSELKKSHGLTVLLIKRHAETLAAIEADTELQAADSLVVVGSPSNIERAKHLFQPT